MKSAWTALGWCLALVVLVGCGDKTTVSGKVTLDGSPLPNGLITFHGGGGSALCGSDAAGNYTLQATDEKGIQTGDYKVTVVANEQVDPATAAAESSGAHKMETVPKALTPAIYADPKTTPLSVTVKSGKNSIPLELKSQ